ncbi:dis1-suppressing protein kinase dsk1 [Teratosphaeria destructans]|uniref:non-specific serine/threonine protein kinase n=1 Tax=Teratosphaeria destructans TaxID=418781 RepID=A0A9W7VYR9_9PEZI|nr:dis1-suppressing protein kinase dsk1 [Teratosphaeria destructans]
MECIKSPFIHLATSPPSRADKSNNLHGAFEARRYSARTISDHHQTRPRRLFDSVVSSVPLPVVHVPLHGSARLTSLQRALAERPVLSSGQCAREEGPESELAIPKRISQANPRLEGWHFVRKLADSFHVDGVVALNLCLAFEPLREPLWLYQRRYIGGVIPPEILKILLQMILHGLDYLHTECQIIHADLKPDNIMIKLEDDTILDRDAQKEHCSPLPQEHIDGRIIYLARNNYGKLARPTGTIQIVDFDRSVFGNVAHSGPIQAEVYRAPEVIVDAGYSYPADIWSLGVMLWDVLEDKMLFRECLQENPRDIDEHQHLAHVTALLGPRPTELTSGRRLSRFYDANGRLRGHDRIPRGLTLESTIHNISGEDKEMFLRFTRKMLKWNPAERSTRQRAAR